MNRTTTMSHHYFAQQRGATLIIAMIILVVMVFVGMAGMEHTLVEERMTVNFRDRSLALNAADASLRAPEAWLREQVEKPDLVSVEGCTTPPICGSGNPYIVWNTGSFSGTGGVWQQRDWSWWVDHGVTYQGTANQPSSLGEVHQQPRSLIEFREFNASSDSGIASNLNAEKSMQGIGWHYYTIIGAGTGYRAESIAVTETTFKKWF